MGRIMSMRACPPEGGEFLPANASLMSMAPRKLTACQYVVAEGRMVCLRQCQAEDREGPLDAMGKMMKYGSTLQETDAEFSSLTDAATADLLSGYANIPDEDTRQAQLNLCNTV